MDRSVDSLLGLVDEARSPEVRAYLDAIKDDQGAMLQLSPESMDLMVAGFGDRPGVRYQSTASMAPTPSPRKWLRTLGHPWQTISLTLFAALHAITSRHGKRYPCAAMRAGPSGGAAWAGDATEAMLARAFGARARSARQRRRRPDPLAAVGNARVGRPRRSPRRARPFPRRPPRRSLSSRATTTG